MRTSMVTHWGYKSSRRVNNLGDSLSSDLTNFYNDTSYQERLYTYTAGRTAYFSIHFVEGDVVTLVGNDWLEYYWVGGDFFVCSGAAYGESATVSSQDVVGETLTLSATISGLAKGDLIRIECDSEVL